MTEVSNPQAAAILGPSQLHKALGNTSALRFTKYRSIPPCPEPALLPPALPCPALPWRRAAKAYLQTFSSFFPPHAIAYGKAGAGQGGGQGRAGQGQGTNGEQEGRAGQGSRKTHKPSCLRSTQIRSGTSASAGPSVWRPICSKTFLRRSFGASGFRGSRGV